MMTEFLNGWGEIAEYWATIGPPKAIRTLMEWEVKHGFPVFRSRIGRAARLRVWSMKSAIKAWAVKNMRGLFGKRQRRRGDFGAI